MVIYDPIVVFFGLIYKRRKGMFPSLFFCIKTFLFISGERVDYYLVSLFIYIFIYLFIYLYIYLYQDIFIYLFISYQDSFFSRCIFSFVPSRHPLCSSSFANISQCGYQSLKSSLSPEETGAKVHYY